MEYRKNIVANIINFEHKLFGKNKNLEIVFTSIEIFDKYCGLKGDSVNKLSLGTRVYIAKTCVIISSQYYDDEYEFSYSTTVEQRKLIADILFKINFDIRPSRYLDEMYKLCQNESKAVFIDSFHNLIICLFIFDTFYFPYKRMCEVTFILTKLQHGIINQKSVSRELLELSAEIQKEERELSNTPKYSAQVSKLKPYIEKIYNQN